MTETTEQLKERLRNDIDYFAKLRDLKTYPPTKADTMATLGLQEGALENPVRFWLNKKFFAPHNKRLISGKLKPETKYSDLEDWCIKAAGLS